MTTLKGNLTLRQLARLILNTLDKVEKVDPSIGVYYEDGKPKKGKGRKSC